MSSILLGPPTCWEGCRVFPKTSLIWDTTGAITSGDISGLVLLRLYLTSSRSPHSHGWGSWPWGESVICTDPHREGQSLGLRLKSVWEQSPCSSDILPGATSPVPVTRPGDPQLLLAGMRDGKKPGGQLLRCFLTVWLVPLAEVRIIRGGVVFWGGTVGRP